ncbi:hypothetical protein GOODEAATRI_012717 [Goodea atripinnis]|uniref:Calpain catalytic domain-containing protein n=1 Tax=Goodea atripinnis TaxID=208336 RepID=A0ABV0MRL6_9TELE
MEAVNDFQGQSFDKLRRSCLRRGALFKDSLFPATNQSLFYKRAPPPGLTWRRPREICRDPRLFVDGISTRDLHQGSLGNCWMVAAISCLASEPSLFWRFGHWVDVVVDDRLPVSQDGVLLFCRSATPREFWSALLEKAYAKLNGCYEALEGGNTAEALIDFTGGVSEPLNLDCEALRLHSERRKSLFQTLAKVHEHKSLITCSIRPAEGEMVESVLDCGLVRGHAYGITAVRKVRLGENLLRTGGTPRLFMVRMRNPWGTTDWKGAWSQGSEQWQQLSRAEREKMGIVVRDVGEFWYHDFCCYFTDVVVCRLVQRTLLWLNSHWRETQSYGEWTPAPTSAAPTIAPLSTGEYSSSALTLSNSNIGPEGAKPRRNKVEVNRCSRVQCVVEQAASSIYMDSRSVTLRGTLAQGRYVVLPTTFLPGDTGRFLLRLFSHSHVHLRCAKVQKINLMSSGPPEMSPLRINHTIFCTCYIQVP